jgi:hypothetical protein
VYIVIRAHSYIDKMKKKCYTENDDNDDNSIMCNNAIPITKAITKMLMITI